METYAIKEMEFQSPLIGSYAIKEMETETEENRLWWIEETKTGDCIMNAFESPHAAEEWLKEYLAE